MISEKKTYFVIIISFILSITVSNIFINKYDSYEISTDSIENHRIIKGDIPDIWIDGETIKRDLQNGVDYFSSGKEIFRSYLPPRLIAIYSYIANYNLFEDWEKKIISSDNKKIYYLIFQSLFYYTILVFFFKKICKLYPIKNCFFIICFLSVEPTIFFFHSSFHTESIYFSLQILMLVLMLDDSTKNLKFIFVGILLGVMFLQKIVTIYYIIPISIFYIYKLKKKAVIPLSLIIFFYLLILLMVGFGNYKRANIFYIMPPSSKITFHLYMPSEILSKGEKKSEIEASKQVNKDKEKWIKNNNINFNSEIDRIKYYNYLQRYTFKILLKHPIITSKYIIWRTLQTGILNPIYVPEFFKFENAKKPPYYLKDNYKKINLPIRIIYSTLLYSIVVFGFFTSRKIIKTEHYVLLTLSSLYMIGMLGWANNSRYFVPILIYLSIFFGNGMARIIEIKNSNSSHQEY